jgi:hypothetical protein
LLRNTTHDARRDAHQLALDIANEIIEITGHGKLPPESTGRGSDACRPAAGPRRAVAAPRPRSGSRPRDRRFGHQVVELRAEPRHRLRN